MVFVMVQGSKVRGVFESVFHAKTFFSDTTGRELKTIKDKELSNGDVALLVDGYLQARLKKTTVY